MEIWPENHSVAVLLKQAAIVQWTVVLYTNAHKAAIPHTLDRQYR